MELRFPKEYDFLIFIKTQAYWNLLTWLNFSIPLVVRGPIPNANQFLKHNIFQSISK